jgi:two-component system, cell cycle sensor histidine kinase and response regulator CckA
MAKTAEPRKASLLGTLGLRHMAHRPPLRWRFWIYSVTAYLLPVVVLLAFPFEPSSLDELIWLVTLVPAFFLSLHYGLRGAFVALLIGISLLIIVQFALLLGTAPSDPRITVPILVAYGALAISVGWLSEELHDHYERALATEAARKTEALGTMAAGIAHDFNNILTAVVANAELIASELPDDAEGARTELDALKGAARRGAGIVRNMLGFSRRGMLSLRALDLVDLVEQRRPDIERLLSENVELEVVREEGLPNILADREAVERVLMNLVSNARDALPDGGTITLTVARARLDRDHLRRHGWGDPGEYVSLAVADDGEGMDEATRSKIFEPFFTEKEPGEGVGLGMAMVYGLMKQHRGYVDVESAPGLGTTVQTWFPVTKDRAAAPLRGPRTPREPGAEVILLVEDEEPILQAARRILEREGYTVLTASDGEEAVRIYRDKEDQVDLLLTDVVLPKLSGPEVYGAIREGGDPVRVLFMSGYPAHTLRTNAELDPSHPFLQKPWSVDEFRRAVRQALGRTVRAPGS